MTVQLLQGDCLQTLKTLEAGSVQCVVTSPPYYGLRDYGVDGQIGLEETPECYVEKLVSVFRECRRVLKDDGVLWLNLGDSYAGSSMSGGDQTKRVGGGTSKLLQQHEVNKSVKAKVYDGMKPKDLMGIPWMVAFALRADGWYLRSDIIWAKPNPMPESVTDRPTKSHEYIFLLSKSAMYYYNAEAILEPAAYDGRKDTTVKPSDKYAGRNMVQGQQPQKLGRGLVQERWPKTMKNLEPDGQFPNTMHKRRADGLPDVEYPARNKRDVWTVTTKPYKEAHFATFPPDLIEPCILAGSREGDTVLDPFNGSGTTGAVAIKHHRSYIGCELNPAYIRLTNKRLGMVQPVLFAQVSP